ncbi:hypothetical protein H5410_008933 [Solanum commersonii]|uniref:Uncharacterized protein n=1 Tax=Solanum commersonii TaxID=4109 RepID=A0A9J6AH90_SOLCO|nr:hypothetical protein H5410_008933 [Solanum commersonii]
METDSNYRRSVLPHRLYGCMSPSCIPVHEEYSQINTLTSGGGGGSRNSVKLWRKLLKKLVNEGKKNIMYGKQKSLKFQYDVVSYSLNFDEGGLTDEYPRRQI